MGFKSFVVRRVHNVLIYAHSASAPSDAEWESVLAFYDGADATQQLCTLVYTEGAAPNASQRARLNAKLGSRRVRIAVLTPSALARAAGTAVHWFRPEVRVFDPTDLKGALAHLDVPNEIDDDVARALNELKQEIGVIVR